MINRAALIIRYKKSLVDWVNEVDPSPEKRAISVQEANEDTTAFLVPDYVAEDFDLWLAENYLSLFEFVLEEWYVDESLWPQDRTLKLFKSWCEITLHSLVVDTVHDEIDDDEF